MAGRRTASTVPSERGAHVRHHPHPPAPHPLHRHPREGGDPGLPPCEERRQSGHRPGGRERRRADRAVVTSGHRSFLWRPTWIPAFAGMTVFSLCRDGRRRSRTVAVAVGRCSHDRWRCRPWRAGGRRPPSPRNAAPMSDTTPTRLRHTPSTVIPAKAGIQVCRRAKDADKAGTGREDGSVEPQRAGGQRRLFPRNAAPMSDTAPTRLRHTPSTVIPAFAGIQVCRRAKNADKAGTGREDGSVEGLTGPWSRAVIGHSCRGLPGSPPSRG